MKSIFKKPLKSFRNHTSIKAGTQNIPASLPYNSSPKSRNVTESTGSGVTVESEAAGENESTSTVPFMIKKEVFMSSTDCLDPYCRPVLRFLAEL